MRTNSNRRPDSAAGPPHFLPGWLLVVALLLAGCSSTGADEGTKSAGQQGYIGVAHNLTQIPPGQRKPLPAVSGRALGSDAQLSTADHAGKVAVVNVWGSWCAECRFEAADLQAASVQTKNVAQFVGIDTRDADPATAQAYVRAFGITYPSIYDPDGGSLLSFSGSLPPSAVPSTLVIDKQGRLAVRILGPITTLSLTGLINDVAAGK